jgi:hypothetical protein
MIINCNKFRNQFFYQDAKKSGLPPENIRKTYIAYEIRTQHSSDFRATNPEN